MFRRTINVGTILCCTPHVFRSVKVNGPVIRAIVVNVIGVSFALMTIFAMRGLNHGPLLVFNSVNVTTKTLNMTLAFKGRTLDAIAVLDVVMCDTDFVFS